MDFKKKQMEYRLTEKYDKEMQRKRFARIG